MSKGIFIVLVLTFTLQVSLMRNERKLNVQERPKAVALQKGEITSARPVRTTSAPAAAEAIREMDLLRFDFQEIYYGFEGPNYTRMKGEPSKGVQLIAQAQLFRPEAVSTAKFEFVDARGRELMPLFFTKRNMDVLDGDFVGVVTVPGEPFKLRVSGLDIIGRPYRRVYPRLFRPISGRAAAPRLPIGIPVDQAASIRKMMELHDQQARARLLEEVRRNPDGTITLPRVEVSDATYEPLVSERGNMIGLRLRYAVRVSRDGDYAFSPSVWPIYANENVRGKIEMQALAVNVDPFPEGLSPMGGALQLRYGGGATYKAGTTYRLVVDMIPNFAIQNAQRTRFCIMRSTFNGSPALEATWRALVTNDRPISYRTNIGWTTFKGRTDSFSGPGVFYQSFVKEGAQECSAGGNINF